MLPKNRFSPNLELHAKIYKDYRRALVRRFPYAIFYEYTGVKVTVYAFFHASRDPQKWRRRLRWPITK